MAAKYSGESQPVVQDGVIYVSAGNDDVFAVSVDSGKILWQYKANLDQKISTVCCGWLNRGVALGDGRVYLGQLDGKVRALDQKTGAVVWTRQLVQWQKGQTITGAPLFLDGKIYIGVVGADFGTRGFLEAMDASTGDSVWRFYTIPAPGEPGSETWPEGSGVSSRAAPRSGRRPRSTRTSNLLYITTGNAGNDWYGGDRPGDNLYAASILAIDRDTGKLKWHFQEVHHDIWDYDSPSAPVLFDVRRHQGHRAPGKTGWLYLLDRETGKPLYGIDEKPVPQSAEQKTAKTQPIPRNGEFIPHTPPTAKEIARVKSQITGAAKTVPVVVAKDDVHAAEHHHMLIYKPGPQGGDNWEPSSYSQKTNMFYVCSAAQTVGVQSPNSGSPRGRASPASAPSPASATTSRRHADRDRRHRRQASPGRRPGPTRATAAPSRRPATSSSSAATPASCRRTTPRTATCSGASRPAPARTTPPTVFEQDGKQYVAFLSAGNSLVATAHGDSLWLFSLDGTLGPAARPARAPAPSTPARAARTTGDAAAGKTVFSDNCAGCHGALGTGGNGGPDLTAIPSAKDKDGGRQAGHERRRRDAGVQGAADRASRSRTSRPTSRPRSRTSSPSQGAGGRGSGRARPSATAA